jgi:dolichol kinase
MILATVSLEYFLFSMIFTIFAFLYPIYVFANLALKEFKTGRRDNFFNYILSIFVLAFNFTVIIYVYIVLQVTEDEGLSDFLNLLVFPILGMWIFILISTIIYHLWINKTKLTEIDEKLKNKYRKGPLIEDFKRKFWHILFYVGLWYGINLLITESLRLYPAWASIFPQRFWEYNLVDPQETFFFLRFLANPSILIDNPVVHAGLMAFFIVAGYITTLLEAIRHSKRLYCPSNQFLIFFMREKEFKSLATYFQLNLSMSLAAFVLPPLLTMSILGVMCIGDAFCSQCGMRWGKRKIGCNPKKSWVGTFAGTFATLIVTSLFIGLPYGIITAVVFMLLDIFTEKPINVSDNLLVPLVLTGVYLLLSLLGFTYMYPSFFPV